MREEEIRPIGEERVSKLCGQVSAFSERIHQNLLKKNVETVCRRQHASNYSNLDDATTQIARGA